MITYTWTVPQVFGYPNNESEIDVIFTLQWNLNGEENGNSANDLGTVILSLNQIEPSYIPLPNQQVLIGWVQQLLGQAQIDFLMNDISRKLGN